MRDSKSWEFGEQFPFNAHLRVGTTVISNTKPGKTAACLKLWEGPNFRNPNQGSLVSFIKICLSVCLSLSLCSVSALTKDLEREKP